MCFGVGHLSVECFDDPFAARRGLGGLFSCFLSYHDKTRGRGERSKAHRRYVRAWEPGDNRVYGTAVRTYSFDSLA